MADRRIVRASVRASAIEFAAWKAKAAAAAEVERERTRQVARIGNNLNQIARWANTYAERADAFELIAHLVAIEREIAHLARFRDERPDARYVHRPRHRLGEGRRRLPARRAGRRRPAPRGRRGPPRRSQPCSGGSSTSPGR